MVDVIGTIKSTLDLIDTIRTTYTGISSVNQDVWDAFQEIDSLSSIVISVRNCMTDPALARANESSTTQGPSLFEPLTNCFWNCNRTVEKFKQSMADFNANEHSRFGKKVWKYAKYKNRTEDFQTIRQQLGTQLASLNTSFSAIQMQRSLQSDERDQQAFTNLQQQQILFRENLQVLNKQRDDVQATMQANPENMDEGSKILHDAEEIRITSLGIEKRVIAELKRRLTIRDGSESARPLSVVEQLTAPALLTEEDRTSTLMRPVRKAVPVGPTFDTKEELSGSTSVNSMQRTITEPVLTISTPLPLLHSTTSPTIPLLPNLAAPSSEPSRSNIHISSEEFETAMSNVIANAEARKKPNRPFSDEDFDAFATLLKQVNKHAWSDRPRTYLLLREIGENRLMDDFILEGCKDIHFPYLENRLPNALTSPSSRQAFLANQYLVLSPKSADLVQGGPHRHLGRSADTGFTIRKRLQRQRAFLKDKEGILAFENEIHNLKRLSHRHLVRFVGSYTDPKYIGIIMEPVADTDLRKYLMRTDFPQCDFPTLQSFFGCLTSAMAYLHLQKCRHKDIKPGNILLKNNQILITDFGIANDWTDLDHDTTAGNPAAYTNAYAAPEVARARPRSMIADV